jgi:ABC-type multidrug transport system fused ATPase/permease subunit
MVAGYGTLADLRQEAKFAAFVGDDLGEEVLEGHPTPEPMQKTCGPMPADAVAVAEDSKSVGVEEQSVESVRVETYLDYFRAAYGTLWLLPALFLIFGLVQAGYIGLQYWVSYWARSDSQEDSHYIYGMAAFAVGLLLLAFLRNIALLRSMLRSSHNIHNTVTASVLHAPAQFFDANPSGRILNKFSKDVGMMDDML